MGKIECVYGKKRGKRSGLNEGVNEEFLGVNGQRKGESS